MSLNIAAIVGRLTATPELKTTQNGISVTSFTVAVDTGFGDKKTTSFINVVAWRGTADFVCKYFEKGSMIAVQGRIQTRNYEDKQGNKRTAFEIVASDVSFCGSKEQSANAAPSLPDANLNELKDKIDVNFSSNSNDFEMIDGDDSLSF